MKEQKRFDEDKSCDACGRFGAFDFGEQHLCLDCYESHGSCCPEFGAEDKDKPESCKAQQKAREQAKH